MALVAFIVAYYFDPLEFGQHQPLSALPAFLFAVVILLVGHNISTQLEIEKTSAYTDRIYEAIKDYMHVTPLGSPEHAIAYLHSRMPNLREVKNTSFNLVEELDRPNEKLYNTETFNEWQSAIAQHSARSLIWKDIGDSISVRRFRSIEKRSISLSSKNTASYSYRIIKHDEPQLNFVIIEYKDGNREVLFNWDFRGIGQDPTVLLSRDRLIIEMFLIQFEHIWRRASFDHDSIATRSKAEK